VAVLAMLALLALLVAALLRVTSGAAAGVVLIMLLPLALPLRGLWRGDPRTSAWATLCVTPYIVYGLTETIANPATRPMTASILFASLALFVLLVAQRRVAQRG
jgi:uncharacterized membrane protein